MSNYVLESVSSLDIFYSLALYSTLAFWVAFVILALWCVFTKGVCKISYEDGNLTGKVAIVTGANAGIGYETAIDLAKRGCKVYIACRESVPLERNPEETVELIKEACGHNEVHHIVLDTSSLKSVRQMAKEYCSKEDKLDILVNNAGISASSDGSMDRILTEEGNELVMATNYFGHFLLTNLLKDHLKKAHGRVVVVSSIAHLWATNVDFRDLNFNNSWPSILSGANPYSRSKLCLCMFAKELAEREWGQIEVASLHPGVAVTQILRQIPDQVQAFMSFWMIFLGKTARQGAQTSIQLAVIKDIVSGAHYVDCQEAWLTATLVRDQKARNLLWEESEKITGLN